MDELRLYFIKLALEYLGTKNISSEMTKKLAEPNWKKDTVYLYQFKRTPFLPNVSPFCLKLETWLRAKNIAYEVRDTLMGRSKYGLLPFVELNGEQLADSQLILLALQKHFGARDLNLSQEQFGFARALDRLADGHTFYLLVKFKFDHARELMGGMMAGVPACLKPLLIPLMAWMMRRRMMARVHTALGNFTDQEFCDLLDEDLAAYKRALGNKPFLFGDAISYADCTLFGQLATTYYLPIRTYFKEVMKRPENKVLVDYLERMKETLWNDDFTVKKSK